MLVLATEPAPLDFRFKILATTADDSIGDAFDKTANLLQISWLDGLGAGPALEQYAKSGSENEYHDKIPRFKIPLPKQLGFSFAGLKSKVKQETAKIWPNLKTKIPEELKRAMAARFQEAAVGQLVDKVGLVLDQFEKTDQSVKTLVASGGVASNMFLRQQ